MRLLLNYCSFTDNLPLDEVVLLRSGDRRTSL